MINSIFIVINLAVFIAICVYGMRKKVIPAIRSRMISEQLQHSALIHRQESLIKQDTGLEREFLHQKHLYTVLSEKINRWNALVIHNRQEKDKLMEQYAEQSFTRHTQQFDFQQQARLRAYVIPAVIHEARNKIIRAVQTEDVAKKYTDYILACMRKEIQ